MKSFLSIAVSLLLALWAVPSHAIDTKAKQAILIDDSSGTILFEKNADELMHPSSMSKLMTLYATFKRLHEGTLKLEDSFKVSENAWRKQGSKSFMELGNSVKVEDLLQGIIVQSGNDACVVIAEGLAGSEEAFATHLNDLGKEIGLTHSHFVNATGWPDDQHLMTARDLALLAHHIIHDFPEYYHYFSEKQFTYHGITQHNRNLLLGEDLGVDGLKTGHTDAGGYGITISANKDNRRLILVVNGLSDEKERAQEAEALVRAGFRDFETRTVLKAGEALEEALVWFGKHPTVPVVAAEDVKLTFSRLERSKLKFVLSYESPIPAPIKKGAHVADLVVSIPNAPTITVPLVAGGDVDKLNPFARIIPTLSHFIFGQK